MNLVEEFKKRSDVNGIPCFSNADWIGFRSIYEKNDIRSALADYIIDNKVPFPVKPISHDEVKSLFVKFLTFTPQSYHPNFVDEKFDFKYKYEDAPLGVIGKSHIYNSISNYYQQKNRYECGSVMSKSPLQIWNDRELLKNMNWHFWRDGVLEGHGINDKTFRTAFRLGTYVATQFKPAVAKLIYQKTNAHSILDMSCGWGDRLVGFYGTPNAKIYVGCDPNPAVYEAYKKQCVDYEKFLGYTATITEYDNYFVCEGSKTVTIYNLPVEDVDWSLYNEYFDVMFSSPPYFETEQYGIGTGKESNQSWSRYSKFELWRDEFLFKVLAMIKPTLKPNGFMMVNIIEPQSKNKRHLLCDDMVEYVRDVIGLPYIGKLLMELRGRPNTKSLDTIYGEPIWCFSHSKMKINTIEDFF